MLLNCSPSVSHVSLTELGVQAFAHLHYKSFLFRIFGHSVLGLVLGIKEWILILFEPINEVLHFDLNLGKAS